MMKIASTFLCGLAFIALSAGAAAQSARMSQENTRTDGEMIAALAHESQGARAGLAERSSLRPLRLLSASVAEKGRSLDLVLALREGGEVTIELFDADGHSALRASFNAEGGEEYRRSVPLPALPAGAYLLRLSTSKGLAQERVMIGG